MAPDDCWVAAMLLHPRDAGKEKGRRANSLPFKESPQKADQPLPTWPEYSPKNSGPTYCSGGWGLKCLFSSKAHAPGFCCKEGEMSFWEAISRLPQFFAYHISLQCFMEATSNSLWKELSFKQTSV